MRNEMPKTFGGRIKYARKPEGREKITQQLLADKIGISLKTIQNWEKIDKADLATMEFSLILKLCAALEVDIEFLTGEIDTFRKQTADIQDGLGISAAAVLKIQSLTPTEKEMLSLLVMSSRFDDALKKVVTARSTMRGEGVPSEFKEEWSNFKNLKDGVEAWGCHVLPRIDTARFYISEAGHEFSEAARDISGVLNHGND